jgi:DNA-binding LytR/AlgR family response regulator
LKKLWTELGHTNFVQLHRSVLVRVDFIERFVHVERHWNARLRDGTTIRVAKGHVQDVLRLIKPESAKSDPSLPKRVSTEVRHDLVFDQSS